MAVAIGGEIALEHTLELIVKRGRALVGARSLVIMLRDGEELVVQASAGHTESVREARLPIAGSTSGQVLEHGRAERISDVATRLRVAPQEFGVPGAQTALLVPMVYRGDAVGILAALTAAPLRTRSARTTSSCCARSRRAPRPRWHWHRACSPTAYAARSPPRTPSAGVGLESCTTRRCRSGLCCRYRRPS